MSSVGNGSGVEARRSRAKPAGAAALAFAAGLVAAPVPPAAQGAPAPTAAPVRQELRPPELAPPVRALRPSSEPAPALRRTLEEGDPYAPLGLRTGGLVVRPAVEQTVGYDTNPERVRRGAKGSALSRTAGEVLIDSDWSRHALTGYLRGSHSAYWRARDASRPEGEGRLSLRIDVLRDTNLDLETRFRLDTQRPGSPELDAAVRGRPLVAEFGAAAGLRQRFNRLVVGLRGSLDRTVFEDARLTSGAVLSQRERDLTQAALGLRAGYELHPGLIPFLEAIVDRRLYDGSGASGLRRSSTGYAALAGSTFEITRTLTGEASAGYQSRDYADARLASLRGPVANAALVWSASPLTTLTLSAASSLAETTIPGSSGALDQRVTLAMRHDLRRWLALTASVGAGRLDYDGIRLREESISGALRLDYKLTRALALSAGVTHERLRSTAPGSSYHATTVLGGVRLQR